MINTLTDFLISSKRETWKSCLLVTLALLVMLGIHTLVAPLIAEPHHFLYFTPVIVMGALMGSIPGFVSLALGVLASNVLIATSRAWTTADIYLSGSYVFIALLLMGLCRFFAKTTEENRRLASKLTNTSKNLEDFFDKAVVPLHWLDATGTIVRANNAELRMLGYKKDEYIGKNISDFHHDQASIRDILEKIQKGEALNSQEAVLRCKNGELKHVLVSSSTEFYDGVFTHTRCFTRDVTERYREEARRNAILDTANDAIVTMDKHGRIVEFNPAAERIFGHRKEKVLGKMMCDIIIPKQLREQHRKGLETYLKSGLRRVIGKRLNTTALRSDGTKFPVEISLGVMGSYDDEPYFAAFIRDITDWQEANNALKENEERFRMTFELAAVGIGNMDMSGHIFKANQALSDILGYSVAELIAVHVRELVPPRDVPKYLRLYKELIDGKLPNFMAEGQFVQKNGRHIWGHFTVSLVRDALGNPKHFIGVLQDITARKEAESALLELNESLESRVEERTAELQQTHRELQDFCFSVSHDMRSPLRNIAGNCHILSEDFGDSLGVDFDTALQHIERSTKKMNTMIDDILSYARMGAAPLVAEGVNLTQMATHIYHNLQEANPRQKINFEVDPNLVVCADRLLIRCVMDNLLENALKFSSKQDEVHIKVGSTRIERDGQVCEALYVADKGCGFNMEFVDKLFEPFQRLHRDEEYPGTGVGLANVKRICERHNGSVWAESAQDKGTTIFFTIALPDLEAETPQDVLSLTKIRT